MNPLRPATWIHPPLLLALAAAGCTLDYDGLATSEGGGAPATTAASAPSTMATSGEQLTATGPGGGEGGALVGPGSGGSGGSQGSGGEGGSVPCCVDATDCDDDNPCTDDACTETCCSNQAVEDGPLGADDPTDCITRTCVGGEPVETADADDDPPDAAPPCDVTTCVGEVPTQVLAEAGTSCGDAPLECDGLGVCMGCVGQPEDECGEPTACATPVCDVDTEICLPGLTTVDPDDPTPGDCLTLECTGTLADAEVAPDDTDTPPPIACSLRGCANGTITAPVLAKGELCLAGETGVCDGFGTGPEACVACRDTKTGATVDAGCDDVTPICDETRNGGDGGCLACVDDMSGDGQDSGCDVGEVCDAGTCVNCYRQNNGVSIGCGTLVCDEGQGTCVACVDDGDGAVDPGCASPTPACSTALICEECRADADCTAFIHPDGERCNRSGGTECGCVDDGDCDTSSQGTHCRTSGGGRCGCIDSGDCDHEGSAGDTCGGNGVCGT